MKILKVTALVFIASLILSCTNHKDYEYQTPEIGIKLRNFSWNVDKFFNIYFDVFNNTDSTAYVMVSDWYLDGMKQRYEKKSNWPEDYFRMNQILYIPTYPANIRLNIKSYIIRHPAREYMPTFVMLAPLQTQRIHLRFQLSFYKMIKQTFNQIKFKFTLFYLTPARWELNQKAYHMVYDINQNIVAPSTKPLLYDIYTERKPIHKGIDIKSDLEAPSPLYAIPITVTYEHGF